MPNNSSKPSSSGSGYHTMYFEERHYMPGDEGYVEISQYEPVNTSQRKSVIFGWERSDDSSQRPKSPPRTTYASDSSRSARPTYDENSQPSHSSHHDGSVSGSRSGRYDTPVSGSQSSRAGRPAPPIDNPYEDPPGYGTHPNDLSARGSQVSRSSRHGFSAYGSHSSRYDPPLSPLIENASPTRGTHGSVSSRSAPPPTYGSSYSNRRDPSISGSRSSRHDPSVSGGRYSRTGRPGMEYDEYGQTGEGTGSNSRYYDGR